MLPAFIVQCKLVSRRTADFTALAAVIRSPLENEHAPYHAVRSVYLLISRFTKYATRLVDV